MPTDIVFCILSSYKELAGCYVISDEFYVTTFFVAITVIPDQVLLFVRHRFADICAVAVALEPFAQSLLRNSEHLRSDCLLAF